MFINYSGVLKVDGEVGNKKVYDLCVWGKLVEIVMVVWVIEVMMQFGLMGYLIILKQIWFGCSDLVLF